jgi:hypothetical protein
VEDLALTELAEQSVGVNQRLYLPGRAVAEDARRPLLVGVGTLARRVDEHDFASDDVPRAGTIRWPASRCP